MRILVSGASGVVGYGILRALRQGSKNIHLIGSTIYNDSVAQGFCDTFVLAPRTSDPCYTDWLCETIRTQKIDLLLPGIEVDMFHWSAHREVIAGCGAIPVLNRTELIELCRDKWTFYQNVHSILGANAIDTSLCSDFSELKRMYGLPFLAKPRQGYAGRGIIKIADEKAFAPVIEKIGSVYMIQPIVGVDDEEYTVSAFCDGEGNYPARMALKRRLSAEGYTEKAETTAVEEFDPLLTRLCQQLRPIGPTNFQFRRHDDVFKLLEINPRISSATSIRTAFGYNESLMAIDFYGAGKLPVQPVIRTGRAVRYAEDYIAYS